MTRMISMLLTGDMYKIDRHSLSSDTCSTSLAQRQATTLITRRSSKVGGSSRCIGCNAEALPLLSTRSKPKGWLVLWLAYQHFPLSYTSAFTTIFEDEIELIFFENVLRLNQVQCNNRTSSGYFKRMRIEIKRYIVPKLELIIRYNRYFFKTKKIQWFMQRKINISFAWIIRFFYYYKWFVLFF